MWAVDWLWDGLSASILSMSQAPNAGALLPRGGKKGLLGSCLQDLCRRIRGDDRFCLGLSAWELYKGEAKDLMAICDEDAGHLRFETVRFWTPEQALDLWQAAVVAYGQNGRARGHRFVRILLFDATKQSMAALHFAEIANDDPELRADHQALQQLLRSAACGLPPPSGRLAEVLSPLIGGNCKPFLLCTVLERPGPGTEAQDLLDLAEQASLITAQCTRVQGIRQEDFRLAHLEDVLRQLRSPRFSNPFAIRSEPGGSDSQMHSDVPPRPAFDEATSWDQRGAGESLDGMKCSDRVLYKGFRGLVFAFRPPPGDDFPEPTQSLATGAQARGFTKESCQIQPKAVRAGCFGAAKVLRSAFLFLSQNGPTCADSAARSADSACRGCLAKVPDSEAAKAKLAEAELFQEYQELAQAVAAMRAKKKAKAADSTMVNRLRVCLEAASGASHRHLARFLAKEPTVKILDSAAPATEQRSQDSVAEITDISVTKVDDASPEEQDGIKIDVVRVQTKMVIPGTHPKPFTARGEEAEKKALKIFEDMFEAWGGKVQKVDVVKSLGKEDRGRLVPFGRQEPKMCVSVEVTVPEFTVKDSATRVIEGRIYKAIEVVGEATEKAQATVAATASAKRQATAQAEATARASYNATASAQATHTAFAEATDQVTASSQASAKALAGSRVKENSEVITKARIQIESSATSVQKVTESATRTANATRTAAATASEGVTVELSQTGTGTSEAEVTKTASATVEDSETVKKSMNVGSEGVGKLKKLFEATVTMQSTVESKACISARKARSLLDDKTLQQTGLPFASAVFQKAKMEAFLEAKTKASQTALDAAKEAAQKKAEADLMAQIQSYATEHTGELKELALKDAVQSTMGQKQQLEAAASVEALQKATSQVHVAAPLKAKAEADLEAKSAAKEEAARLALAKAKAAAAEGLEAKAAAKAMEAAKAKAQQSAELQAKASAKASAEAAAKASALAAAHAAAQQQAEAKAKQLAEAAARREAAEKAEAMVTAGAKA
ncbi:unnamed protein product [Effrenium voratum]|nr:unnamed protein product [Effrenium voratum]